MRIEARRAKQEHRARAPSPLYVYLMKTKGTFSGNMYSTCVPDYE